METFQGNASKEEGYNLLQSGQFEEAIEALKRAQQEDQEDAQIFTFLGVAYNKIGDKMRAIRSFEESLRIDESARGYYNLAMIYESVKRYDEAVREYHMALDTDPNYVRAKEALDKLHKMFEMKHPKPEVIEEVQEEPAQPEPAEVTEVKRKPSLTNSLRGMFSTKLKKA